MTEPALRIYTSNRLDVLVEHLAGVFAAEPLPALEREVIVVQSQGMVRWLTLRLADRLGIAASLSTPFPARFCRRLAERLLDGPHADAPASAEDPSPFDRESLTWRIFERLAGAAGAAADGVSGTASPAAYLEDDPDQVKRYQLSTRLAGLFEGYQLFRPRMLLEWQDAAADRRETAAEQTPEHLPWQAELWRSLVAGAGGDHLAGRSVRLIELLRGASRPPSGLPQRLSVFGVSSLPPIFLELAVALARFIPVRLYFSSPTYHYWGDLRSERETARFRRVKPDRDPAADRPAEDHFEAGHPLIAALGRQGRDFFNLLQAADAAGAAWHQLDLIDPGEDTLLRALQSDVLHLVDRGVPDAPPRRLDAGDDSLSVHACHSPMREMEVLRDRLLAAFEADPELEPADVLVMAPRIGDYSPYVEAAFGVAAEGTPALPFAIADREAGEERPAADAVLRLLELVASRVTPRAVLDLLDSAAVRRAFGIAESEVPELRRWARDTRVRWGIDGDQRAADFAVPAADANTWRAGLDRLLMGYAAGADDRLVAGVAPHAGSTAGDAELLGKLAAFTDVLFRHLRRLRDARPADAWARDLRAAVDDLQQAGDEADDSALELVLDALEELHQATAAAGLTEPISLRVVRAHLGRRLAGEGSGSGFLDGRITFCALKPNRAIPFKVICVAGLNEGAFPRRDPRHSFDLMASEPRPGDRSLAEDDRYLFLETVLAARDRLILTYEGRSQKDNSPRAPSQALAELLDAVDRGFVTADGRPAREQVVIEHRLHPWSPAYYGGDDPRLYSYSRKHFIAAGGGRRAAMPFVLDEDRPGAGGAREDRSAGVPAGDLILELADLVELWVNPSKHYCRDVLQLALPERQDSADAEPFDVDFLDRYRISQWLLERRLRGLPAGDDELELLRGRGELPLAGLGAAHYARLARRVDDFAATLPRHRAREPVVIALAGDGWRLHGRLEGLTDAGALRFRCAGLKPKDLVRAWVTHVALVAWERRHASGLPLATHLAGIDRSVRFGALADAPALLDALVAGYRAGRQRPLPLFEKASHAYVEAARRRRAGGRSRTPPIDAARQAFDGGRLGGDLGDPYVALCSRDRDPLAEDGFARWAEALWTPLLDHAEEVGR